MESFPDVEKFDVQVTREPTGTRVSLVGELDLTAVDTLAEGIEDLIDSGPIGTDVILDLSGLAFSDLLGVRAVRDACRRLQSRGARVRVRGIRPVVRRVLDRAGIDLPSIAEVKPLAITEIDGRPRGQRSQANAPGSV